MATIRKSFKSLVQIGLIRVNNDVVNFGQANLALECNRVKPRGLLNDLPVYDMVYLLLL